MEEFAHLLSTLMSSNNQHRRQAEEQFERFLQENVMNLLRHLLTLIQTTPTSNQDRILTIFSAVLMRRVIERNVERITSEDWLELKNGLFQAWKNTNEYQLSNKLSHVIAQIFCHQSWPELLPSVIEFVAIHHTTSSSTTWNHCIAACYLIEILSEYSSEDINTQSTLLSQFLARSIIDENDSLRMASAKAIIALIVVLEDDTIRNTFRAALEPVLTVLTHALSHGDEIDATHLIENLVCVAQIQPLFFKPLLDKMIAFMLSVVDAVNLEFSTRSMALEWLLTMSETAPAMIRRCQGFAKSLTSVIMRIMLDVDDDIAYWTRQPYNTEDLDEDASTGDQAIQRLSSGLGGKTVFEAVFTAIQSNSQHSDWKNRRAAVAALGRLAEGSPKTFTPFLNQVTTFLLACLQDSNPRVQYEGIQVVGRFASIFPNNCSNFIDSYLPLLASVLQHQDYCARLRGHAASALINLLNPSHCDSDVLVKYLDPLLAGLLLCLQSAPFEVRSPSLVVLGCVAQVCPEQFAVYYGQFMPGIKELLLQARSSVELRELRGKAIECAGLIGEAVGVKNFAYDAKEVIGIIVEALQADRDRDITFEYILPACARMSKALGNDFTPYLPIIYGPLLEGANQEVQFTMEDADEDENEGEIVQDEETGMQSTVVSFGGGTKKRVSIHSYAVQQKQLAARIFYELAVALESHLGSFILPSLQSLSQLVVDKHSDELRSSAALALSKMFTAYTKYQLTIHNNIVIPDQPEVITLFQHILRQLISGIRIEPDQMTRTCLVECLRDILEAVYNHGSEREDGRKFQPFLIQISVAEATEIVSSIIKQCAECVLRYHDKQQHLIANAEKFDEEDIESQREELEEEQELLGILVDIFGQLLKLMRAEFMPIFDQVVAPAFSAYLQADKAVPLQILACSLLDDALEFGGEATWKYLPMILPIFLRNAMGVIKEDLEDDDLVLVQCSVYGLAVICRFTSPVFLLGENVISTFSQVVITFLTILRHPLCQDVNLGGIRENAIYGLGCLLCQSAFHPLLIQVAQQNGFVSLQELSKSWLRALPLQYDAVEAKDSLSILLDALSAHNEVLCGNPQESFPEVVRVLVSLLEKQEGIKHAEDDTEEDDVEIVLISPVVHRMKGLLKQLAESVPLNEELQKRCFTLCQ